MKPEPLLMCYCENDFSPPLIIYCENDILINKNSFMYPKDLTKSEIYANLVRHQEQFYSERIGGHYEPF